MFTRVYISLLQLYYFSDEVSINNVTITMFFKTYDFIIPWRVSIF